ncbi:TerD family protein [Prosthecobacter sp.]|uniref:TerD family protein n=1 Tax=Prosthecobacter sp. TaxID=1965333 RepID=UPI0037844A08
MAINLTKGQRIDVGLQQAGIGLGWNPNTQSSSQPYDLDASAFLLGENGKLVSSDFFVFYNQPASPDGAVRSSGDNTDGEGEGDDETLTANLSLVDSRVSEIIVVVTIHDAETRRQNFGQVRNAFIRIYDQVTGQEICKYELDEDFSTESAVEFGRLYRRGGAWKFEAIGRGHNGGLEGLLNQYS